MEFKNPTQVGMASLRDKNPPREPPATASAAEDTSRSPEARGQTEQRALPDEGERHVHRDESIPHLPSVFRSAMILSHLEGFSTAEIGRLAGVKPRAIESLLVRGRELMQEEFSAYVKRYDNVTGVAGPTEEPVEPPGPEGGKASADSEEP